MSIENVLASRYASSAMTELFSSESKIVFERQLWLAILIAQKQLGIEISDKAIEDYEAVIHEVNLPSINEREKVTRHDVKARIEEFCS
ncbi:MAG: adenylosuccinate lyase, partial [Actinomycetota bacterium]|nr:adenylosuccinate lyase [Actinomycetota bacterium]